VGNARTALMNVLFARKMGGAFLLRFEDTDLEREVPGAEQTMIEALEWLGLVPDESPYHGGDFGPYRTRERAARGDYDKAMQKLKDKGLAYECYMSKEELDLLRKIQTSRGLPPGYDNRHRTLSEAEKAKYRAEGREPVIRFKLPDDATIEFADLVRGVVRYETKNLGGDPVIIRSNGIPMFTFGGAVDDINQNITHVVRGEDHVTNTALQVAIFQALDAPVPQFAHLPLLRDSDGGKLSKRLDSLSVASLKADGYTPQAIVSFLSVLGTGHAPELKPLADLAGGFDFSHIGRAPVRFDMEQVDRLNGLFLGAMSWAEVAPLAAPFVKDFGMSDGELAVFWDAVKHNITRLDALKLQYDICYGTPPKADLSAEDAAYVAAAEEVLPNGPYTTATWDAWVSSIKNRTGRKGKALFMPLRLALTGMDHGPELGNLLPVMGEDTVRQRLRQSAK
jgi:glutamyl-tRNA synthetase